MRRPPPQILIISIDQENPVLIVEPKHIVVDSGSLKRVPARCQRSIELIERHLADNTGVSHLLHTR